jgi:hypothetical protein
MQQDSPEQDDKSVNESKDMQAEGVISGAVVERHQP